MSGLFKLDFRDVVNGAITAGLSAGAASAQQLLEAKGDTFFINWKIVGVSALAGFLGYLIKNLLTTSDGKTLGIEATRPKPPDPPGKE
jgi:hypothetical protein